MQHRERGESALGSGQWTLRARGMGESHRHRGDRACRFAGHSWVALEVSVRDQPAGACSVS